MNLNTLQIALIDDDRNSIQSLISEIDRKTENELFRRAGEHFGFQTAEWSGRQIAYQGDLATIFGYADPSGLRKLAERYDLEVIKLGWFRSDILTRIRATFNLEAKTSRAIFFTWPTFLVAGMVSTTANSDAIKRYLLDCERAARIGGGVIDVTKARQSRLIVADKVVTMVSKADRIRDVNLRLKVLQHLDDALDGALAIPKQDDLFKAAGN